jgi:hypothetical protein
MGSPERTRDDREADTTDIERPEDGLEPLALRKGGFGTALGAAMLGFEQALRNEPPAEILAAEHMPERGGAADDGGLVIDIPEPRPHRRSGRP